MIVSSGFLKIDKDIIKYEGRIYSNITELDWFEKEKSRYQKGETIGEIKRISKSSLSLWNFSATKLPKGTVLYHTDDTKEGIKPLIILAETETGGILYYRWLPKE
ncbi:hypothetical protein KDN24_09085 [Bacillus sp. Bva_UNVM-123]|uniref:hypothetical protein n=1 Tax=Bacillus sp. Bva_UNVM-123 TaxID=2829798 RepID=UPI00391F7B09